MVEQNTVNISIDVQFILRARYYKYMLTACSLNGKVLCFGHNNISSNLIHVCFYLCLTTLSSLVYVSKQR